MRCIEFAWLLAHEPRGTMLDAGSTLNNPPILDRFLRTWTRCTS